MAIKPAPRPPLPTDPYADPATDPNALAPYIDPATGKPVSDVTQTPSGSATTMPGPEATKAGDTQAAPTSATVAPTSTGPPTYDPANPSTFINYYYNQEYGTNAPPDQINYWTGKLNSQEQTGTWDPTTGSWKIADPAYWATRILRQGVDDLNPPSLNGMLPMSLSNAPTTAALGGSLGGATSGGTDTTWMNGPAPAPGWVAVPGVGWVPPDSPAAQGFNVQAITSTSTSGSNAPASIDDAMRTAIMNELQTPNTVDAQSLQNDPAVAAYRIASQRAADRSRAQTVESAIQGGTFGSGALETQKAGIDQQRAEGEAQFVGQIAMQKLQQNRDEIARGIQFAQSMGQFDKAQALQLKLAQMDQAIRQAQVAQSGQLGNRSLDLQQLQQEQQAQQFLDSLGFNYTQLGVNANAMAANAAYGGG